MSELLELPRLPTHVLMPTMHQLLVAADTGIHQEKFGWTPADCQTCKGTGQFKAWLEAPGNLDRVGEFRCPCREQLRLRRWFSVHGLHMGYHDYSLGHALGWEVGDPRRDYLVKHLDRIERGQLPRSAVLYSPQTGTGKTLLSVLLAKAMLKQGMDVQFLTAAMLSTVTTNWSADTSGKGVRQWWTRRVRSCDMLVIDDLGRELNANDWTRERISDLIRHRHSLGLPMLVSVNKDPRREPQNDEEKNPFEQRYGEEARSLVNSYWEYIDFIGVPEFDYLANDDLRQEHGIARPAIFLGIGG